MHAGNETTPTENPPGSFGVPKGGAYLLPPPSWVEMLVNALLSLPPMAFTAPMITTEMPAAMRPYSMAVAPLSSRRKRLNVDMMLSQFIGAFRRYEPCYDAQLTKICKNGMANFRGIPLQIADIAGRALVEQPKNQKA